MHYINDLHFQLFSNDKIFQFQLVPTSFSWCSRTDLHFTVTFRPRPGLQTSVTTHDSRVTTPRASKFKKWRNDIVNDILDRKIFFFVNKQRLRDIVSIVPLNDNINEDRSPRRLDDFGHFRSEFFSISDFYFWQILTWLNLSVTIISVFSSLSRIND